MTYRYKRFPKDLTRSAAVLLRCELRVVVMLRSKTYFEQIPVDVVKKIITQYESATGADKNAPVSLPKTKAGQMLIGSQERKQERKDASFRKRRE